MSDRWNNHRGATLLPGAALMTLLLGLAGGSWLVGVRIATPDMRLGVLTRVPIMSTSSRMGMSGSMSMSLSVFLATWMVMMVAMMVPSVLPAVRSFDAQARTTGQSGSAPVLFTMGYLLVWIAIGGLAYLALQTLQEWPPDGRMPALRVGALLLAGAGVYQLTPLKQACLRHCRSRQGALVSGVGPREPGYPGALRVGLWSGVFCVGSSWSLMLVLLLVGMMNLAWMALIAGAILVEKAMPGGVVFGKLVGCGLVGWGVILLTAAHTMPVLGGA